MDNDALSFFGVDQDYTGGFALTLSGARAASYFFSMNGILTWLNKVTRFRNMSEQVGSFKLHCIEFGLASFTPRDINDPEPIYDDHPYASLVFAANTRQSIIPSREISCQSALTIGVLGTRLAEFFQSGIHRSLGQSTPKGWSHQISDGGEPTAKYTVSLQTTLAD